MLLDGHQVEVLTQVQVPPGLDADDRRLLGDVPAVRLAVEALVGSEVEPRDQRLERVPVPEQEHPIVADRVAERDRERLLPVDEVARRDPAPDLAVAVAADLHPIAPVHLPAGIDVEGAEGHHLADRGRGVRVGVQARSGTGERALVERLLADHEQRLARRRRGGRAGRYRQQEAEDRDQECTRACHGSPLSASYRHCIIRRRESSSPRAAACSTRPRRSASSRLAPASPARAAR